MPSTPCNAYEQDMPIFSTGRSYAIEIRKCRGTTEYKAHNKRHLPFADAVYSLKGGQNRCFCQKGKIAAHRAAPNRSPTKWVRLGKEEQENECALMFVKKLPAGRPTNCEPSKAGRSWNGGARERADDDFFAAGIKRRGRKANFATTCHSTSI